jgi:tetratricopeptide (TPR) repeat protein
LYNFIKNSLMPAICLAFFLSGCASVEDFNTGRGAWNAAEYFYQPPHIKRKYNAALEVMAAGDMTAAATAFEGFNAKYPGYPGAYVNLAIIYDELERPDDAYAMLDVAKEIIPGYVVALNQEGLIKRRRGDFIGARDAWVAATESEPEFANAWYNLGVLNDIYLRDLPAAIVAYQQYQDLYMEEQLGQGGRFAAEDVLAEPDMQVQGWIVDVERRSGQTPRSAQAIEPYLETGL